MTEEGIMLQTAFEKVIVIGYGKITGEILEYIIEKQQEFGYCAAFIEHEVHPFGITEKSAGNIRFLLRESRIKKSLRLILARYRKRH